MKMPEAYMQRALELARLGEGRTRPNPPVGSVIVKDDLVVGEGFHAAAGTAHAEINALRQAGERGQGAVMYVTLEPCSHHGRTGPCAEALIAAGIQKVIVGTEDPNPHVKGRGIAMLREAGIAVEVGLLGKECQWLIGPFATLMLQKRPLVTLKAALTLDGKTATSTGESQWISSEESRQDVHQFRNRIDAIMVGVGTVLRDNPRLTTRLVEESSDPTRIVVDSRLRTPAEAAVITVESSSQVIIATTPQADPARARALEQAGAEILICDEVEGQGVDFASLLKQLGELDIMHLMLEGGATLNQGVFNAGYVDRLRLYMAPLVFGGNDGKGIFHGPGVPFLSEARQFALHRVNSIGPDLMIEGEVR